jgi:hypothetical protein
VQKLVKDGDAREILKFVQKNLCQLQPGNSPTSLYRAMPEKPFFCTSSNRTFNKSKVLFALAAKKTIHDPAKGSADNRCDPEKPEL